MSLPKDDVVRKVLDIVSLTQTGFQNECDVSLLRDDNRHNYKFNPLFKYPLCRAFEDANEKIPTEDKYIAPIPNAVLYRFSLGLYYQLFNTYNERFSTSFGELFELYLYDLLTWCNPSGTIFTEKQIEVKLTGGFR